MSPDKEHAPALMQQAADEAAWMLRKHGALEFAAALEQSFATLAAQLAAAEAGQRAMLKQIGELATAVGVAEGKLHVSELAGIVEGWKERAEAAEAKVADLEGRTK